MKDIRLDQDRIILERLRNLLRAYPKTSMAKFYAAQDILGLIENLFREAHAKGEPVSAS